MAPGAQVRKTVSKQPKVKATSNKPMKPVEPLKPGKPSKPVKPSKPDKPTTPAKPPKPVKPEKLEKSKDVRTCELTSCNKKDKATRTQGFCPTPNTAPSHRHIPKTAVNASHAHSKFVSSSTISLVPQNYCKEDNDAEPVMGSLSEFFEERQNVAVPSRSGRTEAVSELHFSEDDVKQYDTDVKPESRRLRLRGCGRCAIL